MEAQVNNLNTYITTDSNDIMKWLTESFTSTTATFNPSYNTVYWGSQTYNYFWDIIRNERGIKLYGVKCIKAKRHSFTYEAVVFDEFPKDKKSYTICIGNRIEEETSLVILSDTCIRFTLSEKLTGDDFRLAWD